MTVDGETTGTARPDRPAESVDDEAGSIDDGSTDDDSTDEDVRGHLHDVPAGSGCTEIWEHLAENRDDDE